MDKNRVSISVPVGRNAILMKALEAINNSEEIYALWEMTNNTAMKRLGWSDHGPVHFRIVANSSLRICRILAKYGIEMGIVRDFSLTPDHAELVVVLGAIFHDLGMSINREGHEEYSLFIGMEVMNQVLSFLPVREKIIVRGEVQHAIINHRDDGKPMTVEAGIVRIADALDMTAGRARIPFESGSVNIHSLSESAIKSVEILDGGKETPVNINIYMTNSAGLFSVDELLKQKLVGSGLEKYMIIKAYVEGESEKKLISEFVVK